MRYLLEIEGYCGDEYSVNSLSEINNKQMQWIKDNLSKETRRFDKFKHLNITLGLGNDLVELNALRFSIRAVTLEDLNSTKKVIWGNDKFKNSAKLTVGPLYAEYVLEAIFEAIKYDTLGYDDE